MTKIKFLRRDSKRHSKLGKGRRKKQVWRSPKGRDNKMREKRKGYPVVVSIGYKKEGKSRGKIQKKRPLLIHNIKELGKLKENQIAILGNIGKKKKIELLKKAKEKKIPIYNINVNKFLKQIEKTEKKSEVKSKEEPKEKKIKEKKTETKTMKKGK